MTLLEEYHAAHRASLSEKAKGADADAVYARLALRLDVINVNQWLLDETQQRKTDPLDCHNAMATLLGNMLLNFIGACDHPAVSALYISAAIDSYLNAHITGKGKATGIVLDPDTGTQREITIEGLFAERMGAKK